MNYCPTPVELPLLSVPITPDYLGQLESAMKQNGINWVQCINSHTVLIEEAKKCLN